MKGFREGAEYGDGPWLPFDKGAALGIAWRRTQPAWDQVIAIRLLLRFFCLSAICTGGGGALAEAGGTRSVADVLAMYKEDAEKRLLPRFDFAGVPWPPEAIRLVAIKASRTLELWALADGRWKHVREYPVKGMSGGPGPKLREGDLQVPEGLYQISLLNPNSAFHLSLKLDYPNDFDRKMAVLEGRNNLGGNIFIHGNRLSRGCLAMGDRAIEELFVITGLVGRSKVSVLIAPWDFRVRGTPAPTGASWREQLYRRIADEMEGLDRERR